MTTTPVPPSRPAAHLGTGRAGEELITDLLTRAGWRILARNWRPDPAREQLRGELDIVAERGGRATVFEVKTRSGAGYGHPAEAVGAVKLRRLHLLSRAWARENRAAQIPGVDVVCVHWSPGLAPRVEHLGSLGWH